MRRVEYQTIVQAVERLCIDACHRLPQDVLATLQQAAAGESNPVARDVLDKLIENASIAADGMIPLCQDTGLAVVFVDQGVHVAVRSPQERPDLTIVDAVHAGVQAGYDKGFLRKSVVAEPLNARQNTGTNTPAIVHTSIVPGDQLKITVMVKGGGCENKSQFRMFTPTADRQRVCDWIVQVVKDAGADACPPLIVGVGLGGDFEASCLMAKKAMLRDLRNHHPDPFYAHMENDLLSAINTCGPGPQGLGGDTTALAVLIETAACHIASLPVAVNIECHSHRHKTVII